MIRIKVHRKKQFVSGLVPFNIVFDEDIDKIKNAIEEKRLSKALKEDNIKIYPIKTNQTIIFNINKESVRIMAINNNFKDGIVYQLACTDEMLVSEDKNLLLFQSKWFSTIKIELKEDDTIGKSEVESIEYNL